MKKNSIGRSVFAMLFLFVCAAVSAHAQGAANVFAVSSTSQLLRFNSATPGTVTNVGVITGVAAGETIVGIDFRPATGELFALGSNGRLYVINKTTAAASIVATLSVSLSGTAFGIDFNPTVDRLRIVSDTGQNLRVNPANGAAIVDGAINGATTGADAAGYTNSFNGATATTLYDISSATDTLYIQNPPNNGTLAAVGPLGVDASNVNGFDIISTQSTGLAAMTVGGTTNLYSINLTNGAATLVGAIGNGTVGINGIATEIASVTNSLVYGITAANSLISFNSARPNQVLRTVSITGLQGGETLVGIDFRPATGQLFGVGSASRIYRIDTASGAATFVGTLTNALVGTNFGVDFNPVPDRIRITSDADQNLRANPVDGTNVVDGTLAYAAGDPNAGANPNIVASAYTNSFAGATATTLYNIDSNLDILTIQNPPNNGTQNTVGPLGVNVGGVAGFDIVPGSNVALAALQPNGASASALYSINLTTGAASLIGPFGGVSLVTDIAIARNSTVSVANGAVDYDGDGRTDFSVFRPSQNTYYFNRSSNSSLGVTQFGSIQTDLIVPGDYDGDGKTDIAAWRVSNGFYYYLRSSDNSFVSVQWGQPGDEPVARDYDGDGRTDLAVVRRSGGAMTWYILNSANSSTRIEQFGLSADRVAPGDYDGDGRFDLAVYRGSGSQQGTFYVQRSNGGLSIANWGVGSDRVVPGDYDGDGKTDYAVVRLGQPYMWYVLRSSDNQLLTNTTGIPQHYLTQGDYDGDGKTDFAVFDGQSATFYYNQSTTPGTGIYRFGLSGDLPVAGQDSH